MPTLLSSALTRRSASRPSGMAASNSSPAYPRLYLPLLVTEGIRTRSKIVFGHALMHSFSLKLFY